MGSERGDNDLQMRAARLAQELLWAIGVLLGDDHSILHDWESFFWVLFWICVHFNGPQGKARVTDFDCWNYEETVKLAKLKLGTVSDEDIFIQFVPSNDTGQVDRTLGLKKAKYGLA